MHKERSWYYLAGFFVLLPRWGPSFQSGVYGFQAESGGELGFE